MYELIKDCFALVGLYGFVLALWYRYIDNR